MLETGAARTLYCPESPSLKLESKPAGACLTLPTLLLLLSGRCLADTITLESSTPYWLWGGLLGAGLVGLSLLLPRAVRRLEPAYERHSRMLALSAAAFACFEYRPKTASLHCDPEALSTLLGLGEEWRSAPLERWLERLHPDDALKARQQAKQLELTPGSQHSGKLRIRHANGHWEWVELHLAVPSGKDHAAALPGSFRLITGDKELEGKLKRSEQALQLLLDNGHDIVTRFDRELQCQFISRAINRYISQPREELIGHGVAARGWTAELVQSFENECRQLLEAREMRRFELEVKISNRPHVFDIRLFPELDNDGGLVSILSLEHEITESRQTQLLLEEENIVLEMVADNRPLSEVLNQLCRMIETQLVQGCCSVMLLDKQGERMLLAAGPSLPTGFLKAIDGMAIGPNQACAGSAAYWRRTIMVNDIEESPLWGEYRDLACAFGIYSAWAVPIMTNDQHLLGTLSIYYPKKRSPSPDEMQLAYRSSHIAAIAIERDKHEKRLYHDATRDVLTNGFNRRHFLELGMRELKRARRYDMPLALLMLDLDHFKAINDSHGHQVGDEVLRQLSRLVHNLLRGSDMLGRLGGEEFAALLPATGLPEAMLVAERIRQSVEQYAIEGQPGKTLHCSVSVGVTLLQPEDSNMDELLQRADQALYLAKERGRNRVATMPEQSPQSQLTG
jgi:diguanylate cyclase (GGDEF)-like protein